MKFLAVVILLSVALFSRENPFFPVDHATPPAYTTNTIIKEKPFQELRISLPDTARSIESITISYKNIDGSIASKKITVKRSIDWHQPLVISHQLPTQKPQPKATKQPLKKIAKLSFISFYSRYKELKIITKDTLLRNFKLIKPDRIVLDFKRDADFRSYSFKGRNIFKTLKIGNHDGYYRVVIELDGTYIYKIKKLKNGYSIKVY